MYQAANFNIKLNISSLLEYEAKSLFIWNNNSNIARKLIFCLTKSETTVIYDGFFINTRNFKINKLKKETN